MINDDKLLKRLDDHGRWWAVGDARSEDNAAACDEAAARIRELKAERDEAVTQMIEAKHERIKAEARIRELKAQLADKHYKSLFRANSDGSVSQVSCERCDGVHSGTHVIVPVEPNSRICGDAQYVAFKAHCGSLPINVWGEIYRAMIRAAQGATGGVSSTREQEGSP